MPKKYSTITLEQKQHTAWITLNRPDKLNAINQTMLQELSNATEEIKKDNKIKVVIVTGQGNKAFSVGADLTELQNLKPENAAEFSVKGQQVFSQIEQVAKPVLAVIEGYALGGGLELALACDFRLATENSEFGCPEVNLGFLPAWGGTQRLPVTVGVEEAKRLIMQGNRIKADEALEIGLVDRIVPSNELEMMAETTAQRLSECPPDMVKHAKTAVNDVTKTSFELGFKRETEAFVKLFSSKETKEKITKFLSQKAKNRKMKS